MSEDRAKEIIAEKVAKEVVDSIGEEDSSYIKSLLGEQLPDWDEEDWDDLLKNVRLKKYKK